MGQISCKIVLEFDDQKDAQNIASSISPDNEDYIEMDVKGKKINCRATGETPMKLLHTVDDLLACVTIAEENLGID